MTKFKFQLGLIFRRLSLNNMLMHITINCKESHIKGAGGGLHRNSLEIDFIVVSDRGE